MNVLPIEIPRNGSVSLRDTLGVNDNPRHWPARIWQDRRQAEFTRSLTVAIIRNPFDRAIRQWWAHHRANNTGEWFDEWCRRVLLRREFCDNPNHLDFWEYLWWPQWDWITDEEGNRIVDYLVAFEAGGQLGGVSNALLDGRHGSEADIPPQRQRMSTRH